MKKMTADMKDKWVKKIAKAILRDVLSDASDAMLLGAPMIPDSYSDKESNAVDKAAMSYARALLKAAIRAA